MKKKFNQKLVLNKMTIAHLGRRDLKQLKGGYITHTCGMGGYTCPEDYTCNGAYTCDVNCTVTCGCPEPTDDCTQKFQDTCRPLCF